MSLELILWIVAFFVIWETMYILIEALSDSREIKYESWATNKWGALGVAVIFMFIQFFVVVELGSSGDLIEIVDTHYINLLYEAAVIAFIFIFIEGNRKLSKWIRKKRGIELKDE